MKVKTSELIGPALDYAVSIAEGRTDVRVDEDGELVGQDDFDYSTDWAQGGSIIEREEISTTKLEATLPDAIAPHPACWSGHIDGLYVYYGPTPLVAAMRSYVASKLGNEVEIPRELV